MWGITNPDDINELRGRFVTVFLASGLDVDELRWLVDVWEPLHTQTGNVWHVVVPTKKPIHGNRGLARPNNYNDGVAADMLRMYGLHHSNLPCLVFDNFDDTKRQLFVNIPASNADRKRLIENICNHLVEKGICDQEFGSMSDRWRRDAIDTLHDHLATSRLLRGLVGLAPKAASIAGGAIKALLPN